MVVYLGADHRGFELKRRFVELLRAQAYEVVDVGNVTFDEHDDYPDFAAEVARKVRQDPENTRGVVICGSGAGVDIVANKFPTVRSFLGINPDQVFDARHDDNVNVLSIAADHTHPHDAEKMLLTFLGTPFEHEERFLRRLEKISEVENEACT
jgi:ribose 5-phosphate isomerase B